MNTKIGGILSRQLHAYFKVYLKVKGYKIKEL